jgi:hypothetical protein
MPGFDKVRGEISEVARLIAKERRDSDRTCASSVYGTGLGGSTDPVIRAEHQRGYLVDALDLARVRFSEVRKVTGEWGNEP